MAGKKLPGNKPAKDKKPFSDEETKKRIHEHLTNENDKISEQDISNVKTDVSDEKNNSTIKKDKK